MEHIREIKNTLNWHTESGKFEAVIIDGKIAKINFCEPGSGSGDCGKCLNSVDYKFLKQIHDSLADLFNFMASDEKERKYSYANEAEEVV